MNIWLVNQYAMPPEYEVMSRSSAMAKYLNQLGHKVKIISSSTIHNTDINLMEDSKEKLIDKKYGELEFVHIKTSNYSGHGKSRIVNHLQFCFRLLKGRNRINLKPDVIVCNMGIPFTPIIYFIARMMKARFVFEVRDLWPESFLAYGILKKESFLLKVLYQIEKLVYEKSDRIIFTMQGGRDYIVNKKWDINNGGKINLNKIHHINNGVDLEKYEYNREHYFFEDKDLDDKSIFKIIYTGSVRKVNNLNIIVEAARSIKNKNVKFLIWGEGDERELLEQKCKKEGIKNVVFKGRVDKKYVPYILSKSNANLMHVEASNILKYGMSPNKLFDYIAAGKPILSDLKSNYDLIAEHKLGVVAESQQPDSIKEAIEKILNLTEEERKNIEGNLLKLRDVYDFKALANKMSNVLEMEG